MVCYALLIETMPIGMHLLPFAVLCGEFAKILAVIASNHTIRAVIFPLYSLTMQLICALVSMVIVWPIYLVIF